MKLYNVDYLGYATADRRLSNPMIPWILAEIRKGACVKKVSISVNNGRVVCHGQTALAREPPLLTHSVHLMFRHIVINGDVTTFGYFLRDTAEPILYCYLFQSEHPDDVVELVGAMRDQASRPAPPPSSAARSLSNAASLTSLCADISPSSSHFFEVLYVGKIRVNHKKVSDTFIDDTLDKFRNYEFEKDKKNNLQVPKDEDTSSQEENKKGRSPSPRLEQPTPTPEPPPPPPPPPPQAGESPRNRSGSLSSTNKNGQDNGGGDNRTMVLQVGHSDLRLISPDRKQVLLHKHLKDIVCCLQGARHSAHFGFVCREPPVDYNVGYVFGCQAPSVADELVNAITQAQESTKKERQPVLSCEHCPMVWYHKLCADIDNQWSDQQVQACIFRRLGALPEDEQEVVMIKLRGAGGGGDGGGAEPLKEQNQLLMMLLRAHCEAKQSRHEHDTAENRHEFLNHMLGSGAIFMKAKRSLTSSFDQLLKRKGSRDDIAAPHASAMHKELSLPMNAALCKDAAAAALPHSASSSTLLEVPGTPLSTEAEADSSGSPMMNIFLKVGNSPGKEEVAAEGGIGERGGEKAGTGAGSWRQAIFNTVVTPNKTRDSDAMLKDPSKRRDKADLRALWRKAINQQVLLIRMEKENARLKARQDEATVKRIKLEYDDIGALGRQNIEVWETVINREARKADDKILTQAIRQGVPRSKRGEIWQWLAERHCATLAPFDANGLPNYNAHYDELLKRLTSQQHAILIDLGRTFPGHTYFASPLGPGQLALYNLLKAYSLLDPDVGYCQGLSFVAGVLLLHMSEEQAFLLLRHLMFRRQLRAQYLPDMVALQVQLYQLSRLIHDHLPDLHVALDRHEVNPTLFAAPWMLTLFASQFPLGFVTRVFDLLFLEGKEVVFRVALALLNQHRDGLLACDSFEQIMTYLKTTMTTIDKPMMDKILKEVFVTDISKKLLEYEVEYHVLQEEVAAGGAQRGAWARRLEEENGRLTARAVQLQQQLQIATSDVSRLETSRSSHMSQMNRLEAQVRALELTVTSLGSFVSALAYEHADIDVPADILRIVTQINVSERKSLPNNVLRSTTTANRSRGPPLRVINDDDDDDGGGKGKGKGKWSPPPLLATMSSPDLKPKLGRVLTDDDKRALGLMKDDAEPFGKSNSMPSAGDGKRKPLKSSQSSYELGKSGSADLPLISDTVNIRFGGTTKLKTIRPLKTRNESCSSIPSCSVAAGKVADDLQIELRIVEPSDLNGGRSTVKGESDAATLFNGKSATTECKFVKLSSGKVAEEMIKSQVPAKQPSLLT